MIFLKFDRRIFYYFDWVLLAFILCVCAMGILNIYSTGFSASAGQTPFYLKQMQRVVLGLVFMMFIFFVDYRVIVEYAYIIYGLAIVLLVLVFSSVHLHMAHRGGSAAVFLPYNLPN